MQVHIVNIDSSKKLVLSMWDGQGEAPTFDEPEIRRFVAYATNYAETFGMKPCRPEMDPVQFLASCGGRGNLWFRKDTPNA